MKSLILAAATMAASFTLMACTERPVERVSIPRPDDQSAYQPQLIQKPLPPEGYPMGYQPQGPGPGPGQMPPPPAGSYQPQGQPMGMPQGPQSLASPSIKNEDYFVQAYVNRRSPRIMVFVNRTIQGDPLPKDGMEELLRVEEKQSATGAVNVNSNRSNVTNSQSTAAGYAGSSASNSNTNRTNSNSFSSAGPAEFSRTTSVKTAADKFDVFGATSDDYELVEASIVRYFDNSGKIQVKDSEAARGKLTREQILRIENGDPAANRLLAVELQQDVLIRVTAKPTRQAQSGPAVRLIAKAVSTTDARNLGTAFVDMPLPMSKTNINIFTRYLAEELMGQMTQKWAQAPEFDPIEIRVYKTASVDDALKIRTWLQQTPGVAQVRTVGATGGSTTAYAAFAVGFQGAPEDLYGNLRQAIGLSQGLKAIDLQNNTINLEVTGQMNLVTTTRRSETKTTTETKTIEERRVEPINPAPAQPGQ